MEVVASVVLMCLAMEPRTLNIGPGQAFDRPETALAQAHAGDTLRLIAPENGTLTLTAVALRITIPDITIIGVGDVTLSGEGFDYTGVGSVPRAIIQVDPSGRGAVIQHLTLTAAHNGDGNGAGVRINAADQVTLRSCEIHGCDMGVMSAGDAGQARGQRLEQCTIYGNGSALSHGFSHNLYLGGEDVTLEDCTARDSSHGHNLKSRSRQLTARRCTFTSAADREIDLVDSALTADSDSSALLEECTLTKRQDSEGNRGVIHFGRDGNFDRAGVLTLRRCRIQTWYISPVVTLSTPATRCVMDDCRIDNPLPSGAQIISVTQGETDGRLTLKNVRASACYGSLPDSPVSPAPSPAEGEHSPR